MKTLINPWKGLKHGERPASVSVADVKTLINPWKGLKLKEAEALEIVDAL